ncbi:porin [Pseudoalteromonas pernae]|uniref:porin n=1 Tax=Pseudoalteromonas pernae TaxID=3118054 RepID=UPI003242795F
MKFAPSLLVLAVASGMSFSAMADVKLYGKANLTVQSTDEGEGSFTELKSNESRFGIRGGEQITDGLEAVYQFEFMVDVSDADSKNGKDNITARNQFLGLKGKYGLIALGRDYSALRKSQGKVDQFNDLEGDFKNVFKGEVRTGNAIHYSSSSFNGFRAYATYVVEDNAEGDNTYSAALTYGDRSLKESKFYAAIAGDYEMEGYDILRATFATKLAGVKLGAMYQTQERIEDNVEGDGFLVSAAYDINKFTLKAQYQTLDSDDGFDKSGYSIGADYNLHKSTRLFAFYTDYDYKLKEDNSYVGLGLEYKF